MFRIYICVYMTCIYLDNRVYQSIKKENPSVNGLMLVDYMTCNILPQTVLSTWSFCRKSRKFAEGLLGRSWYSSSGTYPRCRNWHVNISPECPVSFSWNKTFWLNLISHQMRQICTYFALSVLSSFNMVTSIIRMMTVLSPNIGRQFSNSFLWKPNRSSSDKGKKGIIWLSGTPEIKVLFLQLHWSKRDWFQEKQGLKTSSGECTRVSTENSKSYWRMHTLKCDVSDWVSDWVTNRRKSLSCYSQLKIIRIKHGDFHIHPYPGGQSSISNSCTFTLDISAF